MAWGKSDNHEERQEGSADFLVKIMYRKNASWQGEICRVDKDEKIFFRSFMEMIMLMQEVLEENNIPKPEYRFRSWTYKAGEGRCLSSLYSCSEE